MLTLLKRLLGLGGDRATRDESSPPYRQHHSATGHLFSKNSPAMRRSAEPAKGRSSSTRPSPKDQGDFNPYNTGKFDRSASWEKISKSHR